MATNFGSVEGGCDDCGCQSEEQFNYRVEERQRLCEKCAKKKGAKIMDADATGNWTCDEHTTKLVKAYCKPCQKGICADCGLFGPHKIHERDDIAKVIQRSQGELQEYMRQLGNKKEDLKKFKTRLSQCDSDTRTMFEAVNDDIKKAVEEDTRLAEKTKREEVERVNQQAEDDIRVIKERRERRLKEIEEEAEKKKKQITAKKVSLTDNLARIRQGTADQIAEEEIMVKSALEYVDLARIDVDAVIKGADKKEQVSKAKSLLETVEQCLTINLSTERIESISTGARKVKFVRKPVTVTGRSVVDFKPWGLIKTIKISQLLLFRGDISNNEVMLIQSGRIKKASLLTVDLSNGNTTKLKSKSRLGDLVRRLENSSSSSHRDKTLVCGNRDLGCASLHSKQGDYWNFVHDITVPGTNPSKNVYVAIDKDNTILAARYGESDIHVMNSVNGQRVRTLTLKDKTITGNLCATSSGLVVVKTGKGNLTVLDESGERNTIHDDNWESAEFTVDDVGDVLYVMYTPPPGDVTRVDAMTLGLDVSPMRSNIIEISPSVQNSGSQIMCSNGKIVVGDGKESLYVYTQK